MIAERAKETDTSWDKPTNKCAKSSQQTSLIQWFQTGRTGCVRLELYIKFIFRIGYYIFHN